MSDNQHAHQDQPAPADVKELTPVQLEAKYVHAVYDVIAPHFSVTRFSVSLLLSVRTSVSVAETYLQLSLVESTKQSASSAYGDVWIRLRTPIFIFLVYLVMAQSEIFSVIPSNRYVSSCQ